MKFSRIQVLAAVFIVLLIAFLIYSERQRVKCPGIYFRKKILLGYNARAIAPFGIYIKESEKTNQALLEHELIHWRQFQDLGLVRFYAKYFYQLARFGYDRAPMEIQARANESEYCKLNYTECARSGQSLTVKNSSFRS